MPTYKLVHRARRGDGTTGGKSATVKSEAEEYDCSPKKNSPSASEVVAEMMTSKLPSSSRDGGGGGGDSEKKKKKQKLSGPENRSSTANGPGDSILLATSTGNSPPPAGKKSNDDSYDSSDDERSLVFKPPGKVVDLSPLLPSDDSNSTPTLAVKENNDSDSESVVLVNNDYSDSKSVVLAPPKAIVLTFSGQGQVIDDQTREVCIDDDFDKIQRDLARRSHLPFDAFTLHLDGRVLGSEDTPRSLKLHEVEVEYRKIEVLTEQGGG